jgi:group I intron endonuclease
MAEIRKERIRRGKVVIPKERVKKDMVEKMERICGIYKITNIKANKVYVGGSVHIESRFRTHKKDLTSNIHINTELQTDWNEIGEEYFVFEKVEVVNDLHDLPVRESYYIKLYTEKGSVYNKSDPMYEYIWGREDKIIVDKGSNRGKKSNEYKLKKEYIVQWLIDNFQEVLIKLRAKINRDQYMEKSKMDKWFLNNIKDVDVRSDDRIEGLINKLYNNLGYNIVDALMYKIQLYQMGIKVDKEIRLILVNAKLSRDLYESKYKNKKV